VRQDHRFSIIIPHRNGCETLLATLEAIHKAVDSEWDEIILVDNHSTDDSVAAAIALFPQLAVIRNPCNNGFGRSCNQGIRRATGQYLLILNNDAQIPPQALDTFIQYFQEFPRVGLLAPQLVGVDGAPQRSFGYFPDFRSETGIGRKRQPVSNPLHQGSIRVETVVGACMAVRRATVEEAGLFDEDFFFYFEETEWCHRLNSKGWDIYCLPEIRVIHGKGISTKPLRLAAQIEMLRSRLLYYRKVFPPSLCRILTCWRIIRLLLNSLSATLLVAMSLGQVASLRVRWSIYTSQLVWLILGRPESWGLPDKCPRQQP
jgi:N-acetylglucosaminyl-diphospho-decaprenol L-rhamnosyltransferase